MKGILTYELVLKPLKDFWKRSSGYPNAIYHAKLANLTISTSVACVNATSGEKLKKRISLWHVIVCDGE